MTSARRSVWSGIGIGQLWLAVAVPNFAHAGATQAESRRPAVTADSDLIDPTTAPRPTMRAVRTDEPIVIDGRLDEPAWQRADVAADFVQKRPQVGYPLIERTEVRVLYDSRNLYVGFVCYDSQMDRLMAGGLERDFSTREGDAVGLAIDTYLDRRNSFVLIVNPWGAQLDEQSFDNGRQVIPAWDGVWDVKTTHTDSAWIAEIAIPFSTLRFDDTKPVQNWGVNFVRIIRRENHVSYWAGLRLHEILYQMSRAGTLQGLEGLKAGRNLRVKPYVLAGHSAGVLVPEGNDGARYDAGVDIQYGLTPGLTMDLTYRTDFGQVELDEEQVNLSRFSLFFPERRDFFVENQGTFSFGDVTERGYRAGSSLRDFSLFHSRRIGITEDGRRIPIRGGGRLSGRVGNFEVGALSVQTDAMDGLPSENFAVARLKGNPLENMDVGAIFVNRAGGMAHNQTFGADANIRIFGHMVINSYLAGTRGSEDGSNGTAARMLVGWRDHFWNTSYFVKKVDEGFDPRVGFVRRRAMRHHYATLGIHPQPRTGVIEEINPFVDIDYITNPSSVLETRRITAGLAVTRGSSTVLSVEASDLFERLDRSFRIEGGVEIPAGEYSFREVSLSYRSSRMTALTMEARLTVGDFWSGSRKAAALRGSWRPRYDALVDLSLERNDVELPEGSFRADVAGLRLRYAFSTSLFWSTFVQYNAQTSQLITNIRGQFRYAPLSDIYLVFFERRDVRENSTLDRGFALKVTRLFAR